MNFMEPDPFPQILVLEGNKIKLPSEEAGKLEVYGRAELKGPGEAKYDAA